MKKSLLIILALLFTMGGVMAKVGKMEATDNVAPGETGQTKVFEFGNSNTIDFGSYKYLVVDVPDDNTAKYRVRICCGDNFYSGSYYSAETTGDTKIVFSDITLTETGNSGTNLTLASISRIFIETSELELSKENVYFSTDDIETMTITTTLDGNSDVNTPFQWYKGDERRTDPVSNNFGKDMKEDIIFGYSSGINVTNGHFKVNGYGILNIHLNSGSGSLRFLNEGDQQLYSLSVGDNIVANARTKCTSFKADWGSTLNIGSIDFIAEYQASNTEKAFDIAASTGSKVSYDRNFVSGKQCTICLPFALTADEVSEIGTVYEFITIASDGKATFRKVTETKAYTPYLFIPSKDGKILETISSAKDISVPTETRVSGSGYTFLGTLQAKDNLIESTDYNYYGFNSTDGKFVLASGSTVSIDAFRAYIMVPKTVSQSSGAARRSIDIDINGTTGIDDVEAEKPSAESFDLSGKRVGKNHKGIVINNGKKIYK